jgi:hypothetical protein
MNDERFWNIIEAAWLLVQPEHRIQAATANPPDDHFGVLPNALLKELRGLPGEDVEAFAITFRHKLYELDSEAFARHSPFGDDGVMDARAFVIGMGREYYETVREDPTRHNRFGQSERLMRTIDAALAYHGCRRMAFLKGPPMATGTNPAGWPAVAAECARQDAFKTGYAELQKLKERHRISDSGDSPLRLGFAYDATIDLTVLGLSIADAEDLLNWIADWRKTRGWAEDWRKERR